MSDVIKNPAHYTEGRVYEPKDVIRDWGLNFNLGNAVKYLARAGRKDDIIQDLKKAQEYIQFEIDALEDERLAKAAQEPGVGVNCRCCMEPMEITGEPDDLLKIVLGSLGLADEYSHLMEKADFVGRMLRSCE